MSKVQPCVEYIGDLPNCFDWKRVEETDDYENQYGHIVHVINTQADRPDGAKGIKNDTTKS